MSDEDRAELDGLFNEAVKWLGANSGAKKEAFEEQLAALAAAAGPVMIRVYATFRTHETPASAYGGGGGGGGGWGGDTDGGADDDDMPGLVPEGGDTAGAAPDDDDMPGLVAEEGAAAAGAADDDDMPGLAGADDDMPGLVGEAGAPPSAEDFANVHGRVPIDQCD